MNEIVVEIDTGERLDVYLTLVTGFTRSYIKQLMEKGHITLNGQNVKSGKKVVKGDKIVIDLPPPQEANIIAQDIPLEIIYEDEDLAVINKQAGISVHPAGRQKDNTLVNALMYRLKDLSAINGTTRPGIVHRLDKDTTGVMVIAKNDSTHLNLSRQLAKRSVKKVYRGIVEGAIKEDNGVIHTLIARDIRERKKMTALSLKANKGREAITFFKVIERFKDYTYVEFDIKTGRTHQIRVHAKFIGHPITGDKLYGFKKQKFNLKGQLLHAYSITFKHPALKKEVSFIASLPQEFEKMLSLLKKQEK